MMIEFEYLFHNLKFICFSDFSIQYLKLQLVQHRSFGARVAPESWCGTRDFSARVAPESSCGTGDLVLGWHQRVCVAPEIWSLDRSSFCQTKVSRV